MHMRSRRAVLAGVVGGITVLAIVWAGGYASGANADLVALTAAIVLGRVTIATWIVGLCAQLAIAIVAALLYAAVFEWITRRAGVLIGLAIAVPHVVVAGLAVGFLPGDRLIGAGIAPPGAFYEYRGFWCLAAFIAGHLVFGSIVGAMYGPTRHVAPWTKRVWSEVAR
jgi:hypothetical protein